MNTLSAMAIPVKAVFDIGKTNKKFLMFDEDYRLVEKQQDVLKPMQDEDGDECENLHQLEQWIQTKIKDALHNKRVKVESLNFSAYGASLVHVNENGKAVGPLYNYLKPYPKHLLNQFYDSYGGKEPFALRTASPPMGMLNSGLQLYWLKHQKPNKFEDISFSLHFPQYLSYLITQKFASEQTSIGCHTGLWDYQEEDYHYWTEKEGVAELLPSVSPVSTAFNAHLEGRKYKTGIGIHDSSAALVPYLLMLDNPFMLVSTGTWSITLNPFNNEPLTYDELQKDCLCYLDIYGNQVKASRLFLGEEYKYQMKRLCDYFGFDDQRVNVELDKTLINRLVKSRSIQKLALAMAFNSGPYPQKRADTWQLENFSSFEEAYHQLMLDLVSIQVKSIELAEGAREVNQLIVSGGFSQNDFFITMLASFLPDKDIYTASLPNASAMGAAMVIDDIKNIPVRSDDLLGLKKHKPVEGLEVAHYRWKEPIKN